MHRIFSKFFKVKKSQVDKPSVYDIHHTWYCRIMDARKVYFRRYHIAPEYLVLTSIEEVAFRLMLFNVWDTPDTWFGSVPKTWKPMSSTRKYLGLKIVNFCTPDIDWNKAVALPA